MGSGKTSVAAMVAGSLGWPVSDSDEEILRTTGKSVRRLQAEIGSAAMHELEADNLMMALRRTGPSVVCAAASVVEDESCRSALSAADVVTVWLRASPATLAARFRSAEHRPVFGDDPLLFLDEQLTARAALFEMVSRRVIDVDERTVPEVSREILSYLDSIQS